MKAAQERMEASNKKFEILKGTLVSQMDIHKAKTEAMQEKMDTNLKEMIASHKEMMAEMKACLQKLEACLESKELAPEEVVMQ
jgi:hypothetical protein